MLKRLSILLLTLFMVVPALAQPEESCECMFAPKAGQWEFDLVLGQNQYFGFEQNIVNTLLPNSYGASIGSTIGSAEDPQYVTTDLTSDLNIGFLNTNNLSNMIGVQARYFITNRIDINVMGSYNVNVQPGKDYVEGTVFGLANYNTDGVNFDPTSTEYDLGDIFPHKAILASVTNSAIAQIGSNYYFTVANERINPYVGIYGQVKWARIKAAYPAYTGQTVTTDVAEGDAPEDIMPIELFREQNRAGQLLGFGGGIAAGVQYSIMPGLILGVEISPVLYQYSLLHLQIDGQTPYYACNHNVSVFKYPQFKLGFRF